MKLKYLFFCDWLIASNRRLIHYRVSFALGGSLAIVKVISMFLRTFLDWSLFGVNDKRFRFLLTLIFIKLFLLFHVYLWSCVLYWWLKLVVQHLQFEMWTFAHWCFIIDDIWTVLLTLLLILDWFVLGSFADLWSRDLDVVDFLEFWAFDWPFDWFWLCVHEWLFFLLHVDWMIGFFQLCFWLVLKLALNAFGTLVNWLFIALLINDLHLLGDNHLIGNWACFAFARRRARLAFIKMLA